MNNEYVKILILGITGKVGSGKSLCCSIIKEKYCAKVFSTDIIAKEIINTNNEFLFLRDKKNKILSNEEIKIVESKLHPLVWKYVIKQILDKNFDNANIILVETALPSEKFFEICDYTINIFNDINIKYDLLKTTRNYDDNIIDNMILSQTKYEDNYKKCDYNIDNNSTINDLENKIINIINKIL